MEPKTKVRQLTPEQEESFQNLLVYLSGLTTNTSPANRDLVAEGVTELYKMAGKPAPKIIWFEGPKEASEVAAGIYGDSISYKISRDSNKRSKIGPDTIFASPLREMLSVRTGDIRRSMASMTGIWDFSSRFRHLDGYSGTIRGDVVEHLFTKWAQREFGHPEDNNPITKMLSAGWSAYFPTVAIFTEPPSTISFDENGFSHCEDGPAIECRDGEKLWRWHGVPVPSKVILSPNDITVDEIHKEGNNDVRSIMVERISWARYLRESGAECIDTRNNEVEGTKEALYKTPFNECRLVCSCPTGRMFTLGLPPDITTCEQAQRWLRGENRFNIIAAT